MGAHKQRWTPEEEAALKAGVLRYGQGKWRTILKDPEFGGFLHLRSNVDLKDKWRNMRVTETGSGSRDRAMLSLERMQLASKQNDSSFTLANVVQSDEDGYIGEAEPVATSSDSLQVGGSRKPIIRLDNVITEAISNLEDPDGSNKKAIAAYIEDQYLVPPSFKGILSAKLKYMTATGELVKMKDKYGIAIATSPEAERRDSSIPLSEGKHEMSSNLDCDDTYMLSKSQIDIELANMLSMTPAEAAAVAARAVAEAEAAIAATEEAVREAEEAEAEAEAAKAFAESVMEASSARDDFYDGEPMFGHHSTT